MSVRIICFIALAMVVAISSGAPQSGSFSSGPGGFSYSYGDVHGNSHSGPSVDSGTFNPSNPPNGFNPQGPPSGTYSRSTDGFSYSYGGVHGNSHSGAPVASGTNDPSNPPHLGGYQQFGY